MRAESFIGLRYLWNTRRTRFLSIITVICVLGIAIGVSALICVQSIMDGLQNQMKRTILGAKTHISVEHKEDSIKNYEEIRTDLLQYEGISGVTPIISRDVILSSSDEMIGAILNGIDFGTAGTVLLFPSQITSGSLECVKSPETCPEIIEKRMTQPSKISKSDFEGGNNKSFLPGIAIGTELAKFYTVDIGDIIKVISPVGGGMGPAGPVPLIRSFRIGAIFFSGLYEYDLNYGYITLKDADSFFSAEGGVDSLGVKLKNVYNVNDAEKFISSTLTDDYTVKNWRDMNRQLFTALEMEKTVWFLILGFIILVAAFNIVSALVMLVMGKKEEIAILRAVGFTANSVMKIFMLDGLIIGFAGTIIGMIVGYGVCVFLDGLTLNVAKDVYYIDKIPVDMSGLTFIYSSAGSMVLSVLAAIYPGRKAAGMSPSEALRHD